MTPFFWPEGPGHFETTQIRPGQCSEKMAGKMWEIIYIYSKHNQWLQNSFHRGSCVDLHSDFSQDRAKRARATKGNGPFWARTDGSSAVGSRAGSMDWGYFGCVFLRELLPPENFGGVVARAVGGRADLESLMIDGDWM